MHHHLLSGIIACLLALSTIDTVAQTKYRPKIAKVSYRSLFDYNTRSTSSEYGNSSSEVEQEQQLKIRLGIPIVMKDLRLIGLQLKYDVHNFSLELENDDYELYNHIESRTFKSLGARFVFRQSLDEKRKISLVAGSEIKSDRFDWNSNTMRHFLNINYKVRMNERTELGGGVVFGYTLSVPQFYPIFTYEHRLNHRWTVDLALPKSAALRFRADDKFYIIAKAEVKGWRYAIHNTFLSESPLTLRKADLNMGLALERELHDWLWLAVDFGLTKNLRYYMANSGDRSRDALIKLQANSAPYVKFGIFIVPPKKLYQ